MPGGRETARYLPAAPGGTGKPPLMSCVRFVAVQAQSLNNFWRRVHSRAHFFAFAAAALAASAALAALLTLLALLVLVVFSSFRPAPPSASANPPASVCTQPGQPVEHRVYALRTGANGAAPH